KRCQLIRCAREAMGRAGLGHLIIAPLLFCLTLASVVQGQSITNGVAMAPPPKWVKSFEEPSAGAFENNATEGESFILLEEQQHAGKGEVYTHVVKKITSQSGVQDGAKVHFSFDPTYQKLDLNFIVLRRGDKIFDRLEPE